MGRKSASRSQRGVAVRSAQAVLLILSLVAVTELAVSSEQRSSAATSEFRIVSGDGYEGAIVPASSPWHVMFRTAITRGRGANAAVPPGLTPWTPEPLDVAATERYLAAWVERAAKTPSQILASLPAEDRPQVERGLPWLAANLKTLKRQYWGFKSGDVPRMAVYGAPDDPAQRWRFEVRVMMGGGCGNFWLDFNLADQRIVRFTCGADE